MKTLFAILHCACWLVLLAPNTHAQPLRTTRGEATIQVTENMSLTQARQLARDQAIIDALQQAFGTSIVQSRITRMESATGPDTAGSTTYFNLIADSYIRGEWIETTTEQFEQFLKNTTGTQQLWLKCTIQGTAREITEARPQLQIEALNCPSLNCQTVKFLHGDRLYVNAKSPIDGYLQLYLEDGDTVFNLLPYQRMPPGQQEAFKIAAEQNYILFSTRPEHNYFEHAHFQEDELQLAASGSQAHQRMYAIFSPTPLPKPFMQTGRTFSDASTTPRNISHLQFQEWISAMKLTSLNFFVQTVDIIIVN